ncbi:hypothetical protein F5B20DRAFT_466320 [Whalleya microplaca]|nr:hypothetical protein F5B20DRAFT_466320 [Whalleya microplaca]
MAELSILKHWHELSIAGLNDAGRAQNAPNIAEDAFHEAIRQFKMTVAETDGRRTIVQNAANMEDVRQQVAKAMDLYTNGRKFPKARRWLQRLSARIMHYGNVLDVLVQHHPEYVSLAWGAMKFLFVAVIDHEKAMKLLAKSLAQLADALPRVEIAYLLYQTDRMRTAVEGLYALILRFLIRAYDWYQGSSFRRAVQSITHPVELTWNDILEEISDCSRKIDQLAVSGSQAEVREIHGKVNKIRDSGSQAEIREINEKINKILQLVVVKEEMVHLFKEQAIAVQAMISSAMLDTNQRITDLQLFQIVSSISADQADKPMKTYQYHLFFRRRHAQRARPTVSTNSFWLSPKLRNWSTSHSSALAIVKGSYQSRHVVRDFCIDVIEQLQRNNVPVIWALRDPEQ